MAGKNDRKLYVAALGVALSGLVLDRLVLSGGALSPGAAQAAPAETPGLDAAVLPAAAAEEPDSVAVLATRLEELEAERNLDLTRVRNAFWLEGVSTGDAASGQAGDTEQRIKAFREAHKLRAVVKGPQGAFVVIGKDRLEVGGYLTVAAPDRTDLFTLTEIQVDHQGRRAVFNFDGRDVVLEMDAPNSAGTGGDAQDPAGSNR